MNDKLIKLLKTKAVFIFLLPVFFVLHGFTENFYFVPIIDAVFLTLLYIAFSLIFACGFWLLYRNWAKACLITVLIMGFHFFFGSMHDNLKKLFPGTFITRYTLLLPAALILFLLLIILLKKRKTPLLRITFFLNLVLTFIILIDIGWLSIKIISLKIHPVSASLSKEFSPCDSCTNPDVYLILLDEYAGNTALGDLFQFDNGEFENQLHKRGFYISGTSKSNYNYTPFSMASMLNMNFLQLSGPGRVSADLGYCYQTIKDNQTLQFLKTRGYEFYNYSIFDFNGHPARVNETFIPIRTRFITGQTFLTRVDRDIRFNTVSGKIKFKAAIEEFIYRFRKNNERIYELTWKVAETKNSKPKFIYTHLNMPHYPYFYDKEGKPLPFEKLTESNNVNKHDYLEYLQYTNKIVLALIDHIFASSSKPPIIVIAGDHGFREVVQPVDQKYYFMNLSSVYLPGKNYDSFYDSMSNVNLFRNVLNTHYNQHLPLLKDSTIFLLY
jgi:sulfatase-like protein